MVIPEHRKNINHEDFNAINSLFRQHRGLDEVQIEYPNFVKAYVVALRQSFKKQNPNTRIKNFCQKKNVVEYLLHHFSGRSHNSPSNMFEYKEYESSMYQELESYLKRAKIAISKDTIANIGEMAENSVEHAYPEGSMEGYSAVGQYYPNIERLEMCIIDHGIGISKKIFDHLKDESRINKEFEEVEEKLFCLAFHPEFSTRGRGGNGLYNIRNKLTRNIRLAVACNNYYYDVAKDKIHSARLRDHFDGTFVHLTFDKEAFND